MLLIPCPWCGPRDELEFTNGGEAHIHRPPEPSARDDAEWADYLFMRANPKGLLLERWVHTHGCRRWFNLGRDTVTHVIHGAYRIGEAPPAWAAGQAGEAARTTTGKARKTTGAKRRRTASATAASKRARTAATRRRRTKADPAPDGAGTTPTTPDGDGEDS